MEAIELIKNVELEVIYEDGTRKRVREGILFELERECMTIHSGTDRKEVLYAVMLAVAKVINSEGLTKEYDAYIDYVKMSLEEGGKA